MTITALIDTITYTPGEHSNRSDPVRTIEEWRDWPPNLRLEIGWQLEYEGREYTVRGIKAVRRGGETSYVVRLDALVARPS